MVLGIFKMIATCSDFLAALKCIKFVFGRGSAHWGSSRRSPRPSSWLKGPYV